jgi:NAD(P)-dependent dehydrogenase (short-subunit alcohol dehydrogenase family)
MATAVVTGAASGIGLALATRLASDGYLVHLADITSTTQIADSVGGVPHVADVSDPNDMERLAATAADPSVICLNAGIVGTELGAPWDVSAEEWRHLLDVNVMGVVNGLRAFVPRLLSTRQPCRLVITASLAGLLTFPGGGAYAATKHATVAVAEQAAIALSGTNVSVTLLCPTLVRTGMSDAGDDPNEVAAQALEAAEAGTFLVTPTQWTHAMTVRTNRLISGLVPNVPSPA